MKKLLGLGALLTLMMFFNTPASACTITCGGGSCSATGAGADCHCDGSSPHCIDGLKQEVTQEFVEYLYTFNSPGIRKVSEAATKILEATSANDLEAYQKAAQSYSDALRGLTKEERQIISAWERHEHKPIDGRVR